jgi:[ribosomal protein S18]-alanine N-acetyltransferase
MKRMSVRAPHPGDVRALAEAEQACFSDPWPGQLFASEVMAGGRFHRVLVDPGGVLVGYLLATWQYLDLHVLKVAVLPVYRRQGLARRLMALAEEHATELGGETVTLEVRESNVAAAALYDSLGFARVGRRTAYYMDGEDALIMTKRLPE